MEQFLLTASNTELCLNVNRQREKLIPQTVKKLNQEFAKLKEDKYRKLDSFKSKSRNSSRNENLLITRKIKVKFIDEPGEGNGVMRSFFTTIADSLLEDKKMPKMDIANDSSSSIKLGNYESVRRSGLGKRDSNLNSN